MPAPGDPDLYQRVCNQWRLVESVHSTQQASGEWDEATTDDLADAAHRAFDEAVPIVPRSLTEVRHYIAMLAARRVTDCPEAVEKAIETLGRAIDGLIARDERAKPAPRGLAVSLPFCWSARTRQ